MIGKSFHEQRFTTAGRSQRLNASTRTMAAASRFVSFLCIFAAVLSAQSPPREPNELVELRREVDSLKQGQKKIQKDLSAVLDILSGKKPLLEDVFVKVAGNPSLGHDGAEVTIVEFTDFQCPFCGAYARGTYKRIVTEYVMTGKVRYISRNFPLEQSHPLARKAAEIATCADDQSKFWELHDRFFVDQNKLAVDYIANKRLP